MIQANPARSTLNIEQLADEVVTRRKLDLMQERSFHRKSLLAGKSRDEQLALVVYQLRARSEYSPMEWYR